MRSTALCAGVCTMLGWYIHVPSHRQLPLTDPFPSIYLGNVTAFNAFTFSDVVRMCFPALHAPLVVADDRTPSLNGVLHSRHPPAPRYAPHQGRTRLLLHVRPHRLRSQHRRRGLHARVHGHLLLPIRDACRGGNDEYVVRYFSARAP